MVKENHGDGTEKAKSSTSGAIDISAISSLTLPEIWRLSRRLTAKSIGALAGIILGIVLGSFSAGAAFSTGLAPAWVYDVFHISPNPAHERQERIDKKRFVDDYSNRLVDLKVLPRIVSSIAKDRPDGLDNPYQITASFLSQVRASGGYASFFSGEVERSVKITMGAEGMSFKWEEKPSLVVRMLKDIGETVDLDKLRTINSNLNWAHFSQLNDNTLVIREPSGNLSLTVSQR